MPTIAGGVYPGQLHAYYELLGPSVAFFLGGAVALHQKDPAAGAKLCVAIIEEAAKLRKASDPDQFSNDLTNKLIEEQYPEPPEASDKTLPYISPQIFRNKALRPWTHHQ